jgi:DeoR family transcriptional regulator, glycerol-3-phosphate regulon repressor
MQKRSKRQREIVSLMRSGPSVSVAGLANELGVSDETIRRELRVLEDGGVIVREHGGARLATRVDEGPLDQRMEEHADAKRKIARAAAALIDDGAILFIDAGTTSCHIAQQLTDRRGLTVITNSFRIASALGGINDNILFLAGGQMDRDYQAFSDHTAQAYVRQFSPHIAILSVGGISLDHGLTDFHPGEAEMSRIAYATARRTLLAADASKFGQHAVHRTAALSQVDILVTDAPLSDGYARAFAGTEIIIA